MDTSLDPYESRLDKASVKYLNAQNGVQIKLWHPSQVIIGSPKPALKRVGFDLFLSLGQK
jgi:hypothetical protein